MDDNGSLSEVLGPAAGLATKLTGLRAGDSLTIVGLNSFELNRALAGLTSARRLLRLEFLSTSTAPLAIERILDDLAELAASAWPNWEGWEQSQANPKLLGDWHLAATRLASEGRHPRFPRLAHEIEFVHLLSVFPELLLLAEIDPARRDRAAPIIEALTWAQRHGAAVVRGQVSSSQFVRCPFSDHAANPTRRQRKRGGLPLSFWENEVSRELRNGSSRIGCHGGNRTAFSRITQ